jgi:hypothetical protein
MSVIAVIHDPAEIRFIIACLATSKAADMAAAAHGCRTGGYKTA